MNYPIIRYTQEELSQVKDFSHTYWKACQDASRHHKGFVPPDLPPESSHYVGTLGEWSVYKYLGRTLDELLTFKMKEVFRNPDDGHKLKTDIVIGDLRWDIKTKVRVPTRLDFNWAVAQFQHDMVHGTLDGYIHGRVSKNFDLGEIAGFIRIQDFDKVKRARKAGNEDPDFEGDTFFRHEASYDCFTYELTAADKLLAMEGFIPVQDTPSNPEPICFLCVRTRHCFNETKEKTSCGQFVRGRQFSWRT